ncbi:MAG: hypothetical protein ACXABN_04880 [Candidatus Thorarchaeota archaeon]|jgi:hypothetical protein
MKSRYRISILMLVSFLMVFNTLAVIGPQIAHYETAPDQTSTNQVRDSPTALFETEPYFVNAEQGWTMWTGQSDGLPAQAYGNRSDVFTSNQMRYFSGNGSTSSTSVSVPMDPTWEGHELFVELTDITENRTWVEDPDMESSPTSWTLDTQSVGGGNTPRSRWWADGHGVGDDCVQFDIDGGSGDPSVGERAWAEQTFTVDRGNVVWAGFRLDYWVESDWGADGFVAIFVSIETNDYTQRVWQKSFPDIENEMVWYDSGLIEIPDLSIFDLSDGVMVTVGLYSQQTVNYSPDLDPYARVDNFELYLKTETDPSDLNLQMNGHNVNDYIRSGSSVPGLGNVTQYPSPTWTTTPVDVDFSWTPTPATPDPDREIWVEFTAETNLYSRGVSTTVTTQDPVSYGENFEVTNSSLVEYETWFFADIPEGYDNRYYFNISLPENRDVYYVGSPLLPDVNISSWDEGHGPAWYANVSAYPFLDRWGYWLIKSYGANIITDVLMTDPIGGTTAQSKDLRASESSYFAVDVGAQFAGILVNITVFSPSGGNWFSEIAAVNATGYANTQVLTFGSNASAGEWIVQAFCSNSLGGSDWNKTGFFRRSFNIVHSSTSTLLNPEDAVSTWITNVTYPDLFLVRIRINDTDVLGTTVSGGQLSYNWTTGTEYFGEAGNGEYIVTLDSGDLPQKGQYILNMEWTHPHYDTVQDVLTINLNFDASLLLEAPDSPGLSIPSGFNGSFQIGFEDYLGARIDTGAVDCNWSSYYSVTPVSGSPGSYLFWLNTTFTAMGEYVVEITGTAPFVLPQNYLLYVEVRELYTKVTYLQNVVDIPVGEAGALTFEWTDVDHDTPLTGMNDSIVSDWSGSYSVIEISPGLYELTIFTTDATPLGTSPVTVSFSGSTMQNHTIPIQVVVRFHTTLFTLEEPVLQTSYGVDTYILVHFLDTDLGLGIDNGSGNVHIMVSTLDLPSLSYTVADLGSGHYNITVPTSQWSTIGWKNFSIQISWTGAVQKLQSGSLDISFRLIGTQTDLYMETAPVATYYLDNFTFSAVFFDVVNSTYISNASGAVSLAFTPIGVNPVTGDDFFLQIVFDNPIWIYEFQLNSTHLGGVGMFEVEIAFQWDSGVLPLYENQTINVFLMVLERPTYIDYTQVPPTPYGEDANLVFTFIDSLRTERIADSPSLSIDINEGGVSWSYSFDSGTDEFTLVIDTSSLGGVGQITLHLNLTWSGTPFYADVSNQEFVVIVLLRSSQLTHLPFTPGQWGNNVTIEFVYTDITSGTTAGMLGSLTLDIGGAFYTVTPGAEGYYTVVLNSSAFGPPGLYFINASIVYTGANYVSDAFEYFAFTVLERSTQMGYESPDNAPYLSNLTFVITYTDDSTGSGIMGASVVVSSDPLSLVLGVDYWVTDMGLGEYLIEIDTSSLGAPASYQLNVTVSFSGAPYYLSSLRTLSASVIERPTQIRIVETPGNTPFLEDVSFGFVFEDFLDKSFIAIDKSHITLSHGIGQTIITDGEYTLTNFGTHYEISFNSTILDALGLVTSHEIQLLIEWTAGSPYYTDRNTTTQASTTFRPTIILFPLVEESPYYDNITINLEYIDFLTGMGIDSATVILSTSNWTVPAYQLITLGNGLYQLVVNTTTFGATGTVYFNISVTWSGSPFYSDRDALNVPAEIRNVQTTLIAEAPPAGSTAIGVPIIVTLTLEDFDHGTLLEGAVIGADWTVTTGNSYQWVEVGNGVYELTLNTSGLVAQQYLISVTATKTFYQAAQAQVIVQPGAQIVEIILTQTTYYGDWGETLNISFWIREPFYFTYVEGFNSTLLWNGTIYQFTDAGTGFYHLLLDTSDSDFGIHSPQITVSREFYQSRQKTFTLVVSKAPGQILPAQSTYDAVIDTSTDFEVYLNNTISGTPVVGATVTMEWNGTVSGLTPTGVPGWYTSSVDVTGFAIGVFPLTIRAVTTNVQFIETNIDINIVPIPTTIAASDGSIIRYVFFGESLSLLAVYNDTYNNALISGAIVSYTLGDLSGSFTDELNGSYSIVIDVSSLASQSIYLRMVATKAGYATAIKSIVITILPVPTEVSATPLLQSGHLGETVSYLFNFTDTQHDVLVIDANVVASWEGGDAIVTSYPNGTYEVVVLINVENPGLYDLVVRFDLTNYTSRTFIAKVEVYATPAEILGPTTYSVPIHDTTGIIYNVVSLLDGSQIDDIIGIAYSSLGNTELELLSNGSYSLNLPGDLTYGIYTFDIAFATAKYSITQKHLEVTIRRIDTQLIYLNDTVFTSPGLTFDVSITYFDLDHMVGIPGVVPDVFYSQTNITYLDEFTRDLDGTYNLVFRAEEGRTFTVTIIFEKEDYVTQQFILIIKSDISQEQQFTQALTVGFGSGLIIIALLIVGYVRIWSVPKQIRELNRMIRALSKGRVPKAASAPGRQALAVEIVNEDIDAVKLKKEEDEIAEYPIETTVPEVNELLEELASITGLGEVEIEAFKADLARMRASERPGFLKEVIDQEKARRADVLAKPPEGELAPEDVPLVQRPEELEDLRQQLLKKGMAADEIDVIIEEAKSLSKADLDALLSSLGIDMD